MTKKLPKLIFLSLVFMLAFGTSKSIAQSFDRSELDINGFDPISDGVTSLMFGPDNRLYVAEYKGKIKVLTIGRVDSKDYEVTDMEILDGIQTMPDHNDDGTAFESLERETLGLTVVGTASNPVIYVTSSDFRIGAGENGKNGDTGLDTNSGVITRFAWNGTSWDVVDIVRGLPRSEENHATNGLEFTTINGIDYLIVASGGFTNAGGPSTNFVFTCEYALSAAVLSVDLTAIEAMPIQTDENGRQYIYDLPTLDDPTRENVNGITDPDDPNYDGIDINDPWGGNDGLNQAIVDPGGPVQIYSPGYRNAYDLVLTESGALYVTDNGANQGWGGFPVNEGGGSATNAYDPNEPGSQELSGGEQIDNEDHLELVTTNVNTYVPGSFYAGHPNPTRANPFGAGLYTDDGTNQVFRTLTYDPDGSTPGSTTDPSIALPANWPPVQVANPDEGDWRGPSVTNPDGPQDNNITIWDTNTNGIDEYTASNFDGAMQGDLLAGSNDEEIRRVQLLPDGTLESLDEKFFEGVGGNALGITCNGDDEVFPGTIWAGTLNGFIVVYEPVDFIECTDVGEEGYDPLADGDFDGYTNQDEVDNGTQICNGGSQPGDFDKSIGGILVSNLNDDDDDNDGIPDALDPFQLGDPTDSGSDAFPFPISNDLFNDQQGLGGIFGLGLTGLMNNGDTGNNWLDWIHEEDDSAYDDDVTGGAPGIMTSYMTEGTALGSTNTQEKGYQYGVQVDSETGPFSVVGVMNNFTGGFRLYGNTDGVSNGELGFFIGDGTQSNYIKFIVTTEGFTALQEIDDVPGTPIMITIPEEDRTEGNIRFYFVVNPETGTVTMEYAIEGTERKTLGSLTAEGTILEAIQSSERDLAVGFIGTSNTPGKELQGTWDFLNVVSTVPYIKQELPDITAIVGDADRQINLNEYFDDDEGKENLTFTVQDNTNTLVGTTIVSDSILSVTLPSVAALSDLTIRATDRTGLFVEDEFTVNVVEESLLLYRVNAGGPEIAAIDGALNWAADTEADASQYLLTAGTNDVFSGEINTTDGSVDTASVPLGVFDTERFDDAPGNPNLAYSFPVSQAGNYEIRLYMGDGFEGTSEVGERIFDVTIEGITYPLLDNIDLSATYGNGTGTMISHIAPINDGTIDIVFIHGATSNPLINAIEILDVTDTETPIYTDVVADQRSISGEALNGGFSVQAAGGDGNLSYTVENLPPGLAVDPTNGQIGGTIDLNAHEASPYNVIVTIDDSDTDTDDQETVNFTWTVIKPFIYRINAGGQQVTATDVGANWEGNSVTGEQTGNFYTVNTGNIGNALTTQAYAEIEYENRDLSIPAYIDNTTFNSIFLDERFDPEVAPEMEFALLVPNNEEYQVRLYMGNSFAGNDEIQGTSQIGERVFDILIEGTVVGNNIDLIEEFGNTVGGMLTYNTTVTDGELNISFDHVVENPLVNAIEIFLVESNPTVFSLADISDQSSEISTSVNFTVSASGGDSNEVATYYISGQPDGISINTETGQISGTIETSAAFGGPQGNGVYTTQVTAIKPLSAPSTKFFTWTVGAPDLFWTDKDENEDYTARHESSFVQAGDKFYLMGGRENAKTVDVYDYTTDSWEALVDSAPFEFNHFQATEYQGLIWVIGSFQTNGFPNEVSAVNIWMFNPATQQWIQGPEIPVARRRGSAGLVVYEDKFYVVAGNNAGHEAGYVSQFDMYDPATGEWTILEDAPRARDHFASAVIGDKMYVSGGRLSGGPGGTWAPTIAEVDVYDFTTGTWSTLPIGQNLPTPRGGASSVNFQDKLLVIGGEVKDELVYGVLTDDALKITEQYDPATQTWERLADLNYDRHGFQAIVSGNGVHVTAGSNIRGGGNQKNMEFLGEDNPVGTPSVASVLLYPESVTINDGESAEVSLEVSEGNVGIYIDSIEISGANAEDFSIASGNLENALIGANATHTLSVALEGAGADRTAVLTITYNNGETVNIVLTNNPDAEFAVTNPGNQYNYEGDSVSLQIEATSSTGTSYSATGLPPDLVINPDTGVITGTIDNGFVAGGNEDSFLAENGLVVIEAESGDTTGWDTTTADGETGILANTNSFANQNGATIPYDITISEPGVYRFTWRSFYSGSNPTDENDNWLRFANNDDVWFFGLSQEVGDPGNEAAIIANLQGAQSGVVFPKGSSRVTAATSPEGNGSNGYFKVYRIGGNSEEYSWGAFTADFDPHEIYVWFVNAGTYTMEISERSLGHAIDRFALYKVDMYGYNYSTAILTNADESQVGEGTFGPGAADNSPYNVSVTVTDNGEPQNSETVYFLWYIGEDGELIAVPQADVTEGIVPIEVNFTGSNSLSGNTITSYSWDFKDGETSTLADPTHTFTSIGTFEVDLTVTDANGTDTKSVAISVTGTGVPPVATASANVVEGEAPLEVIFNAGESMDDIQIVSYAWDFGDETGTSEEVEPTYTFEEPGTYDVVLTVTDIEGLTAQDTVTVTVHQAPVAMATATPETGDAPLEVQFTGSGSTDDIGIVGYEWDFGDDSTSTDQDPVHTFEQAGSYTVTLTVTDGAGLTDEAILTIVVNEPNEAPTAMVSATPEAGDAPLEVSFTGSNSMDDKGTENLSFAWSFGDGNTSSEADPTHTYTVAGSYAAVLTVTDAQGATDSDTITIVVATPNAQPVAVADADPRAGDAPLSVNFSGVDSSDDNGIVSYSWDFANGTTSTQVSPTYVFEDPGTYNVVLTVTDAGGLTSTDTVTITVGQANSAPIAEISADQDSGTAPLTVSFTGSNSTDDNGIVSYAWDFGDGATSTEADPSHTFTDVGTYTVVLTVQDEEGLQDTASVNISVIRENSAPVAMISATPESGTAPLTVSFVGSNSTDDTGITSYAWDFKDNGAVSSDADTSHTFETAGTYEVTLTVTDEDGATNTATVTITVTDGSNQAPVAVASASTESGEAPLPVNFTGSNSTDDLAIVSYLWNFGDGSSSTDADPSHTYMSAGTYTATLRVADAGGLSDTAMITITVGESGSAPVAVATASATSGQAPLTIDFSGSDSTDDVSINSYFWDFGDNIGNSTQENATYTFNTPGVYVVTLRVMDNLGLSDEDTITITVNENSSPSVVVMASSLEGEAPLEVDFTGSGSTDSDGIASYAWDFKDGGTSTEADPTHTFDIPGTYEVELTVTDNQGLSTTSTISIQVNGSAPTAIITATAETGLVPLEVSFSASASTDDIQIVSYSWDFGDGNTSAEIAPTHTFETTGTYTVTLTVTNGFNLTDQEQIIIVVTQNEPAGVGEGVTAVALREPTDGYFNLYVLNLLSTVQVNSINMHDTSGRLVDVFDPTAIVGENGNSGDNREYHVPISTLENALYFITVELSEGDPISVKVPVDN